MSQGSAGISAVYWVLRLAGAELHRNPVPTGGVTGAERWLPGPVAAGTDGLGSGGTEQSRAPAVVLHPGSAPGQCCSKPSSFPSNPWKRTELPPGGNNPRVGQGQAEQGAWMGEGTNRQSPARPLEQPPALARPAPRSPPRAAARAAAAGRRGPTRGAGSEPCTPQPHVTAWRWSAQAAHGERGQPRDPPLTAGLPSRTGSSSRRWPRTGQLPACGQKGRDQQPQPQGPGAGAVAALLPVAQGDEVEVGNLHRGPDLGRGGGLGVSSRGQAPPAPRPPPPASARAQGIHLSPGQPPGRARGGRWGHGGAQPCPAGGQSQHGSRGREARRWPSPHGSTYAVVGEQSVHVVLGKTGRP